MQGNFNETLDEFKIRWVEIHWEREPFPIGSEEKIRKMHRDGLKLTVHAPYKNIDLKDTSRIFRSIEIARDIDSPVLVVHPWNNPSLLEKICRKADDLGVQVALEVMEKEIPALIYDLESLKRTAEGLGCGVCIDFSHLLSRGQSIKEWIRGLEGLIIHAHISDGAPARPHCPMGEGNLKKEAKTISPFLSGFKGLCILEGTSNDLKQSLTKLAELLK